MQAALPRTRVVIKLLLALGSGAAAPRPFHFLLGRATLAGRQIVDDKALRGSVDQVLANDKQRPGYICIFGLAAGREA